MPSVPLLLSQAFNGLALGSLLALVSSGLTIILGTLGVLNFAHGALFMLGAYAIFVVMQATGSFILGVLVGCVFMLVIGVVVERVVMRLFYQRPPEDQILVTFGIGIVLVEAMRALFGGNSQRVPVPGWGEGVTQLGFLIYPTYRLEADRHHRRDLGAVVGGAVPHLDRPGGARGNRGPAHGRHPRHQRAAHVPSGVRDRRGGGRLRRHDLCADHRGDAGHGRSFLVESFVVIVIGGLGSFPGAVLGGLIAGEIISITSAFNSAYSEVMLYAVMALLLVVRPQGLFGTEGRV